MTIRNGVRVYPWYTYLKERKKEKVTVGFIGREII
jgi:hypothetical protein